MQLFGKEMPDKAGHLETTNRVWPCRSTAMEKVSVQQKQSERTLANTSLIGTSLEPESRTYLESPRLSVAGDLTKRAAGDGSIRYVQVPVIEYVIGFDAQL
jgi:hypothetical protein